MRDDSVESAEVAQSEVWQSRPSACMWPSPGLREVPLST